MGGKPSKGTKKDGRLKANKLGVTKRMKNKRKLHQRRKDNNDW